MIVFFKHGFRKNKRVCKTGTITSWYTESSSAVYFSAAAKVSMKTNNWAWNLFTEDSYLYYPLGGGHKCLVFISKVFICFYKVSAQASVSSRRTWLILIETIFFAVLSCCFSRWAEEQKKIAFSNISYLMLTGQGLFFFNVR